jgi:hypothetical protein
LKSCDEWAGSVFNQPVEIRGTGLPGRLNR